LKTILNKHYPLSFCIRSLLYGSCLLIFILINVYGKGEPFDYHISLIFATILFGAAFSWPIFLLCHFEFKRLIVKRVARHKIKTRLCLVAITSAILIAAFFGVDPLNYPLDLIFPGSYCGGVILATFISKIEKQVSPEDTVMEAEHRDL
jgi:hypothetical protein